MKLKVNEDKFNEIGLIRSLMPPSAYILGSYARYLCDLPGSAGDCDVFFGKKEEFDWMNSRMDESGHCALIEDESRKGCPAYDFYYISNGGDFSQLRIHLVGHPNAIASGFEKIQNVDFTINGICVYATGSVYNCPEFFQHFFEKRLVWNYHNFEESTFYRALKRINKYMAKGEGWRMTREDMKRMERMCIKGE